MNRCLEWNRLKNVVDHGDAVQSSTINIKCLH